MSRGVTIQALLRLHIEEHAEVKMQAPARLKAHAPQSPDCWQKQEKARLSCSTSSSCGWQYERGEKTYGNSNQRPGRSTALRTP